MSTLVPRSWTEPVEDIRDRVLSVFDRWRSARTDAVTAEPTGGTVMEGILNHGGPRIDLQDKGDELVVSAELPGLDEKDFHVEVDRGRLVLRGEKSAEREDKQNGYVYQERSYGSFYRAVSLPAEVDADNVEARYKHGILTVRLAKTEEAKARRIKVDVN